MFLLYFIYGAAECGMKNIKSEQGQHYFSKGYYGRGRWFGKGAQSLNLKKYVSVQGGRRAIPKGSASRYVKRATL